MIRWMAEHKVAANLLMIIILFAGALGVKNIKQEVFPEMDLDLIIVAVPYPVSDTHLTLPTICSV